MNVLGIRDFRFFLLARFFANMAIQIQTLIISWWVWRLTHDPLALGLVGLFEVVPFIALAMWGGHLADRHDKKSMILLGETFHLFCTLALLALIFWRIENIWWVYSVIAVTGIVRSFLWSATQAYPQQAVPREIYGRAAAWNSSVWEIGAIGGPAIGGLLYAWIGPAAALGVVAAPTS